jgi:hypothetical protein
MVLLTAEKAGINRKHARKSTKNEPFRSKSAFWGQKRGQKRRFAVTDWLTGLKCKSLKECELQEMKDCKMANKQVGGGGYRFLARYREHGLAASEHGFIVRRGVVIICKLFAVGALYAAAIQMRLPWGINGVGQIVVS